MPYISPRGAINGEEDLDQTTQQNTAGAEIPDSIIEATDGRFTVPADVQLREHKRYASAEEARFKDCVSLSPLEFKLIYVFEHFVRIRQPVGSASRRDVGWPFVTMRRSTSGDVPLAPSVPPEHIAHVSSIPKNVVGEIVWSWSMLVEHEFEGRGGRVPVAELEWSMFKDFVDVETAPWIRDLQELGEMRTWIEEADRAFGHWYDQGGQLENETADRFRFVLERDV